MKPWWTEFWTVVWIVKLDVVLAACAIASAFTLLKWALAHG